MRTNTKNRKEFLITLCLVLLLSVHSIFSVTINYCTDNSTCNNSNNININF